MAGRWEEGREWLEGGRRGGREWLEGGRGDGGREGESEGMVEAHLIPCATPRVDASDDLPQCLVYDALSKSCDLFQHCTLYSSWW